MSEINTASSQKSPAKAILLAGLLAGCLDACGAMTHFMIRFHGANPLKVWRFVASGALGQPALTKSLVPMAAIGIVFHFIVAFCFTLFFFFIFPKIKFLGKNLIITGLIYGIFVWLLMNFLVLPLSGIPDKSKLLAMVTGADGTRHLALQLPPDLTQMIIGILIIMFCVGLPISLIIGRYYSRK